MGNDIFHDPLKEVCELRNQLSYTKRIGFLFGSGTSKALNISDIKELTKKIKEKLNDVEKNIFDKVQDSLQENDKKREINIEEILDQIRLIRQITNDKESKNYEGINGKCAEKLDKEICNKIYDIILEEERVADLSYTKRFMTWLNWISRDFSKEIFTTNYDLIIEKSLESLHIPYFDGFIGSNEPFFLPESLEDNNKYDIPPVSWIRLWKIHGSLGWFWKRNEDQKSYRVVRLGVGAKKINEDNELVIYPSKEKYESSRKQPFIAYFDRLRYFLQNGEGLFVISGYSFSDEHINAIIFDSLKQNNRLHATGFFFNDDDLIKIYNKEKAFLNFSAFGPKKAIIKGFLGEWKKTKSDNVFDIFWDNSTESLKLGDFKEMVKFLLVNSGKQEKIEEAVKENNDK